MGSPDSSILGEQNSCLKVLQEKLRGYATLDQENDEFYWFDKLDPKMKEFLFNAKETLEISDTFFDAQSSDVEEQFVATIKLLKGNHSIQKLKISRPISLRLAISLQSSIEHSVLTELDLTSSQLGTTGTRCLVKGLQDNLSITKLVLTNCHIGRFGAEDLGKLLYRSGNIIELDVSYNHIRNEGMIGLFRYLQDTSPLQILNLDKNSISNEGVSSLISWVSYRSCALKKVDLSNNPFTIRETLKEKMDQREISLELSTQERTFPTFVNYF